MIEAKGLSKSYGSKVAVDDLSFEVHPGRVTGFLGPNGSGKSTTMRVMLQLDVAETGQTLFDGQRYADIQYPTRTVGSLLEAHAVHPKVTARNHLRALAAANRIPETRVDHVFGQVGLTDAAERHTGGFSLGMFQRLGLATALLGDPGTLILDEPMNGLDPEGIHWIRSLLRELAQEGRTVFVSSHLLAEMAETVDDLVVIGRGRLIAQSALEDFVGQARQGVRVRSPRLEELTRLLAGLGAETTLGADGSLTVIGAEPSAIGDLAAAQSIPLHELTLVSFSLEEAFLDATAGSGEYTTMTDADAAAATEEER
ncbi:MAG TPA: ATP-binding cassette domain-containing protein [Actinomycetota bacterium]|nr:ATP-binding cassette domain-containing protein [Actinomycetota bacterium]